MVSHNKGCFLVSTVVGCNVHLVHRFTCCGELVTYHEYRNIVFINKKNNQSRADQKMASKDNNVLTFPLSLPVEVPRPPLHFLCQRRLWLGADFSLRPRGGGKQLQLGIWALLDRGSLCNASLVCHAWHQLSSDNHLWVPPSDHLRSSLG
jgi:hypothetical protein